MELQTEPLNQIHEQKESLLTFPEKRKYLVVEDDFTLQPIWEHIIRSADPKAIIRWARTEEGAEKLINDREKIDDQFDFVVADIMLAGEKNGVDLWKQFREKGILFLFTTGISEKKFTKMIGDSYKEHSFYLRKPLYIPDCIECINGLLAFRQISK
jgi:response regulator of citrate/malate metabolism